MSTSNVLIVDDDVDFADGLAEIVEILGHRAVRAHSAEEALEALATDSFDIAFVDVGMAHRNGVELCSDIAAHARGVRCVLMTGYGTEVLKDYNAASLNVPLVTKPVYIDTIKSFLSR